MLGAPLHMWRIQFCSQVEFMSREAPVPTWKSSHKWKSCSHMSQHSFKHEYQVHTCSWMIRSQLQICLHVEVCSHMAVLLNSLVKIPFTHGGYVHAWKTCSHVKVPFIHGGQLNSGGAGPQVDLFMHGGSVHRCMSRSHSRAPGDPVYMWRSHSHIDVPFTLRALLHMWRSSSHMEDRSIHTWKIH